MKNLITAFFVLFSLSASANFCATVYQGPYMTGHSLHLYDGTQVEDLGEFYLDDEGDATWDNRISSLSVEPNCKLVTYQYQNFGRHWDTGERIGEKRVYKAKHGVVKEVSDLYGFDERISSLKCVCK